MNMEAVLYLRRMLYDAKVAYESFLKVGKETDGAFYAGKVRGLEMALEVLENNENK